MGLRQEGPDFRDAPTIQKLSKGKGCGMDAILDVKIYEDEEITMEIHQMIDSIFNRGKPVTE
jgi:hypothetical protein